MSFFMFEKHGGAFYSSKTSLKVLMVSGFACYQCRCFAYEKLVFAGLRSYGSI